MKILLIEDDLKKEQLKNLIDFISLKSDKISLTLRYHGKLSEKEFNDIQREYKELILREDLKRREKYKNNVNDYKDSIDSLILDGYKAEDYFNDILEQELDGYKTLKYNDYNEIEDKRFKSNSEDFIEAKFTRTTLVTSCPLFEVCYFKLSERIKKLLEDLNSLLEYPINIENFPFEDLAFYNDNKVIFASCSHEGFAYMNLEDKDYEGFLKLNVNHRI